MRIRQPTLGWRSMTGSTRRSGRFPASKAWRWPARSRPEVSIEPSLNSREHWCTPGNQRYTQDLSAGSDYFRVMGYLLSLGASSTTATIRAAPLVVIVNQSFVHAFWPKAHPLGRRFRTIARNTPGPWRTVVGVVPNIMQGDATRQTFKPIVYIPARQQPGGAAFLFARTSLPGG